MTKFLSTSCIDRTLPEEFDKEDWKEYLLAKYREEAMKIINCLKDEIHNEESDTPILH